MEAFEIEEQEKIRQSKELRELNDWIRNKARHLLRDLSEDVGVHFLPKEDEALEQVSFRFVWDDLSFVQLQPKD